MMKGQRWRRPSDSKWRTTLLWAVLLAGLTTLAIILAMTLYPSELPKDQNPDFVDNIFDNRAVILAARLLLVSAAVVLALGGVFIFASTVVRMRNREWLRRAGPFEVAETTVSDIEGLAGMWRDAALTGQEEVAELTKRLDQSDKLAETLKRALDDG